ncbi:MAG: phage major capsid protein [Oscillospiraceae bacterium]|nr:phage major capsid protein [Oscillospiraceae bacterium]
MNLKALEEKRSELIGKMENMVKNIETEARPFNEGEEKEFENSKKEVESINSTIKKTEELRAMNLIKREPSGDLPTYPDLKEDKIDAYNGISGNVKSMDSIASRDIKAFVDYIRNPIKNANFDVGSNGAIIPVTIATQIIEAVRDICPIYSLAKIYNIKGELRIPYYGDNSGDQITCGYAPEFTELTAHAGKFTAITLNGYTAGVLSLISKSLIGKAGEANINLVNFVVSEISKRVAVFLEHELLLGSGTNACQGIITGATNVKETSSASTIKADDLIDLQESIPDVYQRDAVWIMNHTTRAAIRKFKDGNGQYLLNQDLTAKWGYTLLGKPVYTSDAMPALADSAKAVIYGDMTGLAVKFAQNLEMQILNEHYYTQHALGICGWLEIDSKVADQQKLAILEIAAA